MEDMKGQYSSAKRRRHWTHEEDLLLKKCVEKHGQGNWHLIPSRAGIKRCRKSCRLRWLNYLCPNIKRGDFTEDEDDLIFKLHKLLGNRWSLIAGRIPGRTANDVKNHWNCHLSKKLDASNETNKKPIHEKVQVIKPQPRILSKDIKICPNKHNPEIEVKTVMAPPRVVSKPVKCWENLLSNEEDDTTVASGDIDEVKQQSIGNIPWFDGMELVSQAEAALMAEDYEWEALTDDKDLCYGDWLGML